LPFLHHELARVTAQRPIEVAEGRALLEIWGLTAHT
jgi:hypothetical protein